METYEEQIFPGFEEELTCLAPGYPASQPPLPGSDEARTMTAGSGRQLSMLLDSSSPLGAFSRILLESSHWTNSEEYCYVWNRLDTRFALSAFQLTPLGQSIGGNECSLWPTAHANCATGAGTQGREGELNLQTVAKLRPTPMACEPHNTCKPDSLRQSIKDGLFPTPAARDYRSPNTKPYSERGGGAKGEQLPNFLGGSLNPRFVEELMGFPIDHTALKHWETLLSRSRRIRSL